MKDSVNTSAEAQQYLSSHPDVAYAYSMSKSQPNGRLHTFIPDGSGSGSGSSFPHSAGHRHQSAILGVHRGKFGTKHQSSQPQPPPSPPPPPPPQPLEYEEDVPYQERHSVRKHGRYNTNGHHNHKQMGATTNSQSSENRYYDYDTQQHQDDQQQQQQQQQQQHIAAGGQGNVPWANGDHGRINFGWNVPQDPYDSISSSRYSTSSNTFGGIQQDDPYGLFGDGSAQDSYAENRRLQQDSGWRRNQNYGTKYGSRLKKSMKHAQRFRRHVGPHDMGGIQRIISTGTLAPVLDSTDPNANHSIDVIFATYWFFPSKTQAILPEDRDCIQRRMGEEEQRFKEQSQYYGMDHDAYEAAITKECISPKKSEPEKDPNGTFESQSGYDPFNIHMGQMTVYRLRLTCDCQGDARVEVAGKKCAQVKPFDEQSWAAYMGSRGDGHFANALSFTDKNKTTK